MGDAAGAVPPAAGAEVGAVDAGAFAVVAADAIGLDIPASSRMHNPTAETRRRNPVMSDPPVSDGERLTELRYGLPVFDYRVDAT